MDPVNPVNLRFKDPDPVLVVDPDPMTIKRDSGLIRVSSKHLFYATYAFSLFKNNSYFIPQQLDFWPIITVFLLSFFCFNLYCLFCLCFFAQINCFLQCWLILAILSMVPLALLDWYIFGSFDLSCLVIYGPFDIFVLLYLWLV